jgi:hypothetical protein
MDFTLLNRESALRPYRLGATNDQKVAGSDPPFAGCQSNEPDDISYACRSRSLPSPVTQMRCAMS